jgi:hypothetical protein
LVIFKLSVHNFSCSEWGLVKMEKKAGQVFYKRKAELCQQAGVIGFEA